MRRSSWVFAVVVSLSSCAPAREESDSTAPAPTSGSTAASGSTATPGSTAAPGSAAASPRAAALRQAARDRPTDAAAHLALARAYFDAREDAAGKAHLFRALALTPEDPAVMQTLAEVTPRIADISLEAAYAARDRLDALDGAAPGAPSPAPAEPPAPGEPPAPAATVPSGAPPAAPTATPADVASTPARPQGGPRPGRYECYFLSGRSLRPRLLLAHTVAADGTYLDYEGEAGTYTFDPASRMVAYAGATLDGKRARVLRSGSLAFQSRGGDTGECDRVP